MTPFMWFLLSCMIKYMDYWGKTYYLPGEVIDQMNCKVLWISGS